MSPVVLLVAGLGVVVAVLVAVTTLTGARATTMLSMLGLLAISPAVFSFDLDWVQKALVAAVLLALLLRLGMRRDRAAGLAVVLLTASLLVGLLPLPDVVKAPPLTAVRAWAGFALPWLFLFVRWRPEDAPGVLRTVMRLPIVTLPFGIALQLAGIQPVVPLDGDTPRLGGAMIPATLALMAVVGVWAAVLDLVTGSTPRSSAAWLVVDLVMVTGTLTRGGILAAAILVAGLGVWSMRRVALLQPRVRRVARVALGLLVVLLAVAVPGLLLRSQGNSYEGAFNTSGREQAWPFFVGLWQQSPVIGRGLGFSTISVALYDPTGVQHLIAPHDEYIHFAVDGGVLLLAGYLVVLGVAFAAAARAVPPGTRVVVLAMVPALALYAATDNPFSTPQFLVPFVLVLSALAARARAVPAGEVDARVLAVAR